MSWLQDFFDEPIGVVDGHVLLLGRLGEAIGVFALVLVGAHLIGRATSGLLERRLGVEATHRRHAYWYLYTTICFVSLPWCLKLAHFDIERTLATLDGLFLSIQSVGTFLATIMLTIGLARLLERLLTGERVSWTFLTASQRVRLGWLVRAVVTVIGFLSALSGIGISTAAPLVVVGGTSFSVLSMAVFFSSIVAVAAVSEFMGSLVGSDLLSHTDMDRGAQYAVGRLTYYIILVVGVILSLDAVGLRLSSLTVLLGAFSVGIGIGLQNIVNNFVSGLIVLLERPIKVGDVIELDTVRGRVRQINARSTVLTTVDNLNIIVPNADFMSKKITNWTHDDSIVCLKVNVVVDVATDLEKVESLLLKETVQSAWVLPKPPPSVAVKGFGSAGLALEVDFYVNAAAEGFSAVQSELTRRFLLAFRRDGIPLPSGDQVVILKNQTQTTAPKEPA